MRWRHFPPLRPAARFSKRSHFQLRGRIKTGTYLALVAKLDWQSGRHPRSTISGTTPPVVDVFHEIAGQLAMSLRSIGPELGDTDRLLRRDWLRKAAAARRSR